MLASSSVLTHCYEKGRFGGLKSMFLGVILLASLFESLLKTCASLWSRHNCATLLVFFAFLSPTFYSPTALTYPADLTSQLRSRHQNPVLDRYGFTTQVIRPANKTDFQGAFDSLGKQNKDPAGALPTNLRNFLHSQSFFESAVMESNEPLIFRSPNGDVKMIAASTVQSFKGWNAAGVYQTSRRSGYIKGRFTTAKALQLKPEEDFAMIFTEGVPPSTGLREEFAKEGIDTNDYFFIWFLPQDLYWAVGEKLPLLPYGIPRSELQGHSLKEFDFKKAKFITLEEALGHSNQVKDSSKILEAGLHIPLKKQMNGGPKELFIPLTKLQQYYKAALRAFQLDVGLNNIRNFTERASTLNARAADVIAETNNNFRRNEANPLQGPWLESILKNPSDIPNPSKRARTQRVFTNGPASRFVRAVDTTVSRLKLVMGWSKKKLTYDDQKSLEENKFRYRRVIGDSQLLFEQMGGHCFGMCSFRNQPADLNNFPIVYKLPAKTDAGLKQASRGKNLLFHGVSLMTSLVISSVPWLMLKKAIIPLFQKDGKRIFASWSMVGGMTALTFVGIRSILYFRAVTIRDAHALGLMTPEGSNSSKKAETELEKVEQRIGNFPSYDTENPVRSRLAQARSALSPTKNFLRLRRLSLRLFYRNANSPEEQKDLVQERLKKITNNGKQPAVVPSFLSWLFSKGGGVYQYILHPNFIRFGVGSVFPYYFETRDKGGRASLRSAFQDWGILPRGVVPAWRFLAYAAGGVVPGFKPDMYWENTADNRLNSIARYGVVEPAIGRALQQLEAALALDERVEPVLVASILSTNTGMSGRSELWEVQKKTVHPDLSQKELLEIERQRNELRRISDSNEILDRVARYAQKLLDDTSLTPNERVNRVSERAKALILAKFHAKQKERGQDYYHSLRQILQSTAGATSVTLQRTFWRAGSSPSLLVNPGLSNLGDDGANQILDRGPVSVQVGAGILANIPPGASSFVFLSSMMPFYIAMIANNITATANNLVLNTRLIQNLREGHANDPNASFLKRLSSNIFHLPFKKTWHQVGFKVDQSVASAITAGTLTLIPIFALDATLKLISGQMNWQTLGAMGLGLLIPAGITAAASIGIGLVSIPYYTITQVLRVASGNGSPLSRPLFSVSQLPLNILYGVGVGWAVATFSLPVTQQIQLRNNLTEAPAIVQPAPAEAKARLPTSESHFNNPAPIHNPAPILAHTDRLLTIGSSNLPMGNGQFVMNKTSSSCENSLAEITKSLAH